MNLEQEPRSPEERIVGLASEKTQGALLTPEQKLIGELRAKTLSEAGRQGLAPEVLSQADMRLEVDEMGAVTLSGIVMGHRIYVTKREYNGGRNVDWDGAVDSKTVSNKEARKLFERYRVVAELQPAYIEAVARAQLKAREHDEKRIQETGQLQATLKELLG